MGNGVPAPIGPVHSRARAHSRVVLCRYEASGVALTEKARPRRLTNLLRRDSFLRLLEIFPASSHGIYFYATIAFLAGFSERRAKVLLDGVLASDAPDTKEGEVAPRAPATLPLARPTTAAGKD